MKQYRTNQQIRNKKAVRKIEMFVYHVEKAQQKTLLKFLEL